MMQTPFLKKQSNASALNSKINSFFGAQRKQSCGSGGPRLSTTGNFMHESIDKTSHATRQNNQVMLCDSFYDVEMCKRKQTPSSV